MAFEAATTITQLSSHKYQANFSPNWVIGSVPHGGYVTACFLRVASLHFRTTLAKQNQPHTLALHLDFLRRTQTGPAEFVVQDLKLGRQTSVVQITLTQAGSRVEVLGTVTQADLNAEAGFSAPTGWKLTPEVPAMPRDGFALMEADEDPGWREMKAWPLAEFRKATTQIRSWYPRGGQRAGLNTYDVWMALADGSRWGDAGVGVVCDMFPQMMERLVLKGKDVYDPALEVEEAERLMKSKPGMWYPTLLLNLEVKKALPVDGERFLGLRVQTKQVKNGRYDLEVVIVDGKGELVALSHHVVFAVSAARNLAKRSTDTAQEKL